MRRFTTVITNASEHVNLCAVMLAPIQTHSSQVGYVCDLDVIQGGTWTEAEKEEFPLFCHISINASETTYVIEWIKKCLLISSRYFMTSLTL